MPRRNGDALENLRRNAAKGSVVDPLKTIWGIFHCPESPDNAPENMSWRAVFFSRTLQSSPRR